MNCTNICKIKTVKKYHKGRVINAMETSIRVILRCLKKSLKMSFVRS